MRGRLAAGVTLGVLAQVSSVGLLLTSAWLIVRAAQHPPVLYLTIAIVGVRFFGLARPLLRYCERLMTHDVVLARATDARVAAYVNLERAAPFGLTGQRRGDVVSRVVSDVLAVQDRLLRIRLPWTVALATSAIAVGFIFLSSPAAAAILALYVALSTVAIRVIVPLAVSSTRRTTTALRGAMAADVSLLVRAAPDLVAFEATGTLEAQLRSTFTDVAEAERRGAWATGAGAAAVMAAAGAAIVALSQVTASLPAVLAGVVILAPLALLEPIEALADAERLRPGVLDAERRLAELDEMPSAVTDADAPSAVPDEFDLVVRDLTIGWQEPLVSGLSFDVRAGEVLAITGPSGSGKSTLGLTLARLLEPLAGSVTLGGVDITCLSGAGVGRIVGMLGQDDVVFDTTIRENLRIADVDSSGADMLDALDRAGLGDFVNRLPDRLDTMVGESGAELSGGERQRLGLARLLLGGHRVLVLDEPTEHLDTEVASRLVDDLVALSPEHSVLIITHSPDVMQRCDAVVRVGSLPTHATTSTAA